MLESEVSELEVANVVTPAKAEIQIDYDDVYFDDEFDHDSSSQSVKETNEDKVDDDSDCSHNNDSEEEMPDDSDDDGYDEYGGHDRGYYYDGRYERKYHQ